MDSSSPVAAHPSDAHLLLLLLLRLQPLLLPPFAAPAAAAATAFAAAAVFLQARCQGCPDWLHYEGCNDKQRDQQVGNAVPYPVAVEVAGSVWEAATGQPYSGLPILKGPSPAGIGLAEADSARWKGWWEGLQPEGKHEVVLGWKEAMMDGGLRELKEPQRMQNEKRKKGQQGSRPGKRSRTSTPAASGKGSAGAAAADSGAAGGSMEESASQQ